MKAIITVIGKDTVGILAKVSAACAADNANIVEVTQSVLQDMFAMVMLIEFNEDKIDFEKLRTDLDAVGEDSCNARRYIQQYAQNLICP
jgi:ACT domain-containing protein